MHTCCCVAAVSVVADSRLAEKVITPLRSRLNLLTAASNEWIATQAYNNVKTTIHLILLRSYSAFVNATQAKVK